MYWKYILDVGVVCEEVGIELHFGAAREDLRKRLKFDPKQNKGRFTDEDSYGNSLENPAHWFRLFFSKKKQSLENIEILAGTVEIEGVSVEAFGGDLRAALRALKKKGYDFKKGDYSYTDVEHKIDLGESGANGAEQKNQVCWIMIAKR